MMLMMAICHYWAPHAGASVVRSDSHNAAIYSACSVSGVSLAGDCRSNEWSGASEV